MKPLTTREKLLGVVLLAALCLAARPEHFSPAKDAGTTQRLGKVAIQLIPAGFNGSGWCAVSDSRSGDRVNVKFEQTITVTSSLTGGFTLNPGETICDPVAGAAMGGTGLTAIAQTTASTIAGFSPGPVVKTYAY